MRDLKYMRSKHTTRSITICTATEKIKKMVSVSRIVTPSGMYEEKEWKELLLDQAKQLHELDVIDKLKKYKLDNYVWIKTEEDAYEDALQSYSMRLHENKKWVDYEEFQSILNMKEEVSQISLF